jgi:hypothetical protein
MLIDGGGGGGASTATTASPTPGSAAAFRLADQTTDYVPASPAPAPPPAPSTTGGTACSAAWRTPARPSARAP